MMLSRNILLRCQNEAGVPGRVSPWPLLIRIFYYDLAHQSRLLLLDGFRQSHTHIPLYCDSPGQEQNIIPLIRTLLNTKYYSLNQDIIKYLTPCSPLSSVCHVPCTCPPGCPPRPPLHRTAVRLRRSTRTASMRLVCMTGNLSNSFLESRLHMYLGGAAPDILE